MAIPGSLTDLRTKRTTTVTICGREYTLRKLSGSQVLAYHEAKSATPAPSFVAMMTMLVGYCLCDKDGNRLVTDDEVRTLEDIDFESLRTLFEAAAEFNRLTTEAVESTEKK